MNRRRRSRRSGFTLLEVLLVLVILVVLASTATFYLSKTQASAYKRTAKVQIHALEQLVEQYHIDVGSYPPEQFGLKALKEAPSGATKWDGPYGRKAIGNDPWGTPYVYKSQGDAYSISSAGPDRQAGTDDDIIPEA